MKKILLISFFLLSKSLASDFREDAQKLSHSLKKNLMGSLQKEMNEKGVIAALNFCHLNVKEISQKSSEGFSNKYEFGRTSHLVRNEKNRPEEWMDFYLEQFKEQKNTNAINIVLKDGKKAYLEPLWVMPMCLSCHGENISTEVATEIKKRYPKDLATGFKVGDFRGLIWIKEK